MKIDCIWKGYLEKNVEKISRYCIKNKDFEKVSILKLPNFLIFPTTIAYTFQLDASQIKYSNGAFSFNNHLPYML